VQDSQHDDPSRHARRPPVGVTIGRGSGKSALSIEPCNNAGARPACGRGRDRAPVVSHSCAQEWRNCRRPSSAGAQQEPGRSGCGSTSTRLPCQAFERPEALAQTGNRALYWGRTPRPPGGA
jgi:hypothetical protein